MKLKPTMHLVGDVELTKMQYLHHNTTASTLTSTTTATIIIIATTATKTTTTINSTATAITTGAINTTNKYKGIKAKILGNIVTILK